jgi:hypothetical protein
MSIPTWDRLGGVTFSDETMLSEIPTYERLDSFRSLSRQQLGNSRLQVALYIFQL